MDRTIDDLRLADVEGAKVLDPDGEELGKVDDLFHDEQDGAPSWVKVKRGWRAGSVLVPLRGAERRDGNLVVPYGKDVVDDAPDVGADERLGAEEERRLLDHYRTGLATARAGDGNGNGHRRVDERRFRTVDVPVEIVTLRTIEVDAEPEHQDDRIRLRRQDLEIERRPWRDGDERRQPAPDGVIEIVLTREEIEEVDGQDTTSGG